MVREKAIALPASVSGDSSRIARESHHHRSGIGSGWVSATRSTISATGHNVPFATPTPADAGRLAGTWSEEHSHVGVIGLDA
jgi:hypothetical protein